MLGLAKGTACPKAFKVPPEEPKQSPSGLSLSSPLRLTTSTNSACLIHLTNKSVCPTVFTVERIRSCCEGTIYMFYTRGVRRNDIRETKANGVCLQHCSSSSAPVAFKGLIGLWLDSLAANLTERIAVKPVMPFLRRAARPAPPVIDDALLALTTCNSIILASSFLPLTQSNFCLCSLRCYQLELAPRYILKNHENLLHWCEYTKSRPPREC